MTSKPGSNACPGMSLEVTCLPARRRPAYRWRELGLAFHAEHGNRSSRAGRPVARFGPAADRGSKQPKWQIHEGLSSDVRHRGGRARTSVEGPVMGLEQRGPVTRACRVANRVCGRSPDGTPPPAALPSD